MGVHARVSVAAGTLTAPGLTQRGPIVWNLVIKSKESRRWTFFLPASSCIRVTQIDHGRMCMFPPYHSGLSC